jgi:cytochrome c peroxidase
MRPLVALFALLIPATAGATEIGSEQAVPRHLDHARVARGEVPIEEVIAHGRLLFEARFTTEDGAGRPGATGADIPTRRPGESNPAFLRTSGPDANACAGCHNQPEAGGAGDFVANAFVAPQDIEYDFESTAPELAMERGTSAVFGAGLLELLAREMTRDLHALRDGAVAKARATGAPVRVRLITKGVDFGRLVAEPDGFLDLSGIEGVHPDLIVKPFSHKAAFTSLRQFTINAANTHHGMQAEERFGLRWTGDPDFDRDGVGAELSEGDLTALVLFQATLPPPRQVLPDSPALREAAVAGEALFDQAGCTTCHRPALPLEDAVFGEPGDLHPAGQLRASEGPVVEVDLEPWFDLERDGQGRLLVPAFTDLKRHVIADARTPHFANERLSQNFVPRDVFRTAPLWGVGSTAPYGHRGDLTTLRAVILAHGGEAADSRAAFEALEAADQGRIIEFLKSLQIDPLLAAEHASLAP